MRCCSMTNAQSKFEVQKVHLNLGVGHKLLRQKLRNANTGGSVRARKKQRKKMLETHDIVYDYKKGDWTLVPKADVKYWRTWDSVEHQHIEYETNG